ncbi:hypothetical protein F5Y15DRAFT_343478 [Xylariaceae sp. FL0016]|nr:hypothetical protein F5Y15DRAFT_343478 [Xylariaceae sp. FL0016]
MCGDNSRQSLGGALAILKMPLRSHRDATPVMTGRLTFHRQLDGDATATHATLTADEANDCGLQGQDQHCTIGIHETGDLTRSAVISPFLYKFKVALAAPSSGSIREARQSVDVELNQPLKIEVGGNGIIGRRVSVWTRHHADPVAEGIIGYN